MRVLRFSMTENVDDHNWDSPLNRLPEARTAFKILKHSFAVRGNVLLYSYGVGQTGGGGFEERGYIPPMTRVS